MSPTAFDLVGRNALRKGLPWSFRLRRLQPGKTPVDLTGCAARMEIYDALAPRTQSPLVTLSSATGEIVLGGAAGTLVAMLGSITSTWSARNLRYRLFFTDSLGIDGLYLYGRLAFMDGEW